MPFSYGVRKSSSALFLWVDPALGWYLRSGWVNPTFVGLASAGLRPSVFREENGECLRDYLVGQSGVAGVILDPATFLNLGTECIFLVTEECTRLEIAR